MAHLSAREMLAIINRSLATNSAVTAQKAKPHLPRELPTHAPVLPQPMTEEEDPKPESK